MNQKGTVPILFIIIVLVIVGLIAHLQYNKSTNTDRATSPNSIPNSGNPYQDLKVGLKKAFEK